MGVLEEDPEKLDPKNLGDVVGPFVNLKDFNGVTHKWFGTVLIVAKTSNTDGAQLSYSNGDTTIDTKAIVMLQHGECFDVRVDAPDRASEIAYSINVDVPSGTVPSGRIPLQATGQAWHVAGYSCNDQRQYPQVGTACWKELKKVHAKAPFHLLLGTGDQLYNDNVWNGPKLKEWLGIEKEAMKTQELNQDQIVEVRDFYFFAYMRWMKYHPAREELSGIPQLNTWDDHDIFDGWGSYPEYLQTCPAFTAIFKEAQKFYKLFQLHTDDSRQADDHYLSGGGDNGCSWITQLGPNFAVAALDTRAGRSRDQIIHPDNMGAVLKEISELPNSVKHVLFVSAVPMLYPEVSAMEGFMSSIAAKKAFGVKTGLYNGLMNDFGEPELLDDILDHWSSSRHEKEKGEVLHRLRTLAKQKGMRVSLMSGDVHLCGFSFSASNEDNQSLAQDPGFIPQIISSAIAYDAPPNIMVRGLDFYSGTDAKKVRKDPKDPLYETIAWLFKDKSKRIGISPRFCNRNNFTEYQIQEGTHPMLQVTWRVRKGQELEEDDIVTFEAKIPPLLGAEDTEASAQMQKEMSEKWFPVKKKTCFCC